MKSDEMAETISREMGAPLSLSRKGQVPAGLAHLAETVKVLRGFQFQGTQGSTLMRKEPIGVCGLRYSVELADESDCLQGGARPSAAGCTMVLENPVKWLRFPPICLQRSSTKLDFHRVVFNLVNGDGPTVGSAIRFASGCRNGVLHGSTTRGSIAVALAAAPTVKRVTKELGGKSANNHPR